ncbi:MAG: adenylate kinase [Candidatus Woesearchaeota archaeon]|nr:adenylate kinase [Candidatus Woesearchaeota archaeon]
MIILISGTPGTGKSELAKKVAKSINALNINITDFVKDHELSDGYDEVRECLIVDEEKLSNFVSDWLKSINKKDVIIEGHLAHFIKGDLVVVIRCSVDELYKRLKARGYNENKIRENVEAEIFGICEEEARKKNKEILILDSSKETIEEMTKKVLHKIEKMKNGN